MRPKILGRSGLFLVFFLLNFFIFPPGGIFRALGGGFVGVGREVRHRGTVRGVSRARGMAGARAGNRNRVHGGIGRHRGRVFKLRNSLGVGFGTPIIFRGVNVGGGRVAVGKLRVAGRGRCCLG